jgi:predicted nucleic acid-binding protein
LRVIEAAPHDYRRMAELLTTYASLRLQVVDACVIALAERLDVREVAALDRRDFLYCRTPAPAQRRAAHPATSQLIPLDLLVRCV